MALRLPPIPLLDGLHYAVRILIGTTLVWLLSKALAFNSPVWALITVIVVSEPHMKRAWTTFLSRFVNTLIGSAVGLLFLVVLHAPIDLLPLAAGITALLSIYVTRMQQGWRIGPVTTAIVMSASLVATTAETAVTIATERTESVLLGSAVSLAVTFLMGRIWVPRTQGEADDGKAS